MSIIQNSTILIRVLIIIKLINVALPMPNYIETMPFINLLILIYVLRQSTQNCLRLVIERFTAPVLIMIPQKQDKSYYKLVKYVFLVLQLQSSKQCLFSSLVVSLYLKLLFTSSYIRESAFLLEIKLKLLSRVSPSRVSTLLLELTSRVRLLKLFSYLSLFLLAIIKLSKAELKLLLSSL